MLARDELVELETICRIGDAAVRELERVLGNFVYENPFDTATVERREELEAGVMFILDNPAAPLSAQHDAWRARNAGRLPADDPRLVPFDKLPFGLQLKARLWRHIVHAIVG